MPAPTTRTAQSRRTDQPPPRAGHLIALHGASGGVGTTMIAAELACLLASSGRHVLALDADLQRGSLHYRLDVPVGRATFSIADVLPVLDDLSTELLRGAVSESTSGAWLLPAPPVLEVRAGPGREEGMGLARALRSSFEFVIADTAASFDGLTLGLLEAAETVLLVVTPELGCLGAAKRALGVLQPARSGPVELVVNRSLGQGDLVGPDEISSFLSLPALRVLPEDTGRCRRLGDQCRPVCSERSALAREITGLARALFGQNRISSAATDPEVKHVWPSKRPRDGRATRDNR